MTKREMYELCHTLACEHDLTGIELTAGINGYPTDLRPALIGFDTIEYAERIAKQTGGEVRSFHQRDGWQLWEDKGPTFNPFGMIEIYSRKPGEIYRDIDIANFEVFLETEFSDLLDGIETMEQFDSLVLRFKKLYDTISTISDEEFVHYDDGEIEVVPIHAMEYSDDSHRYVIGITWY